MNYFRLFKTRTKLGCHKKWKMISILIFYCLLKLPTYSSLINTKNRIRHYLIFLGIVSLWITLFKKGSIWAVKICHTYPTIMNLVRVITYLKEIQKIYGSRGISLGFCLHQYFYCKSETFFVSRNTDIVCISIHNL